jgi:hypothetical protein
MVTERQAEAPKGAEKAQNLQRLYGVQRFFEGFSKKVSSSVEELLDRSYETGLSTLRGAFRADSTPIGVGSKYLKYLGHVGEL